MTNSPFSKIAALIAIGTAACDLRNDPFYLEKELKKITEGDQQQPIIQTEGDQQQPIIQTEGDQQQPIIQKKFEFKDLLRFINPLSKR